jgi:hypothetical protein
MGKVSWSYSIALVHGQHWIGADTFACAQVFGFGVYS